MPTRIIETDQGERMKLTEYEKTPWRSKDFGPSVTRTAGVMTMKQQIDRLQAAQIIQGTFRKAHFPADTDVPDDFIPPEYGMDEMDAIDAARLVVNGMAKAKARQAAVEARKAKETVETPAEPEPTP